MQTTIAIIMTNVLGGGTVRHAKEMVKAWSVQGNRVLYIITADRVTHISVFQNGQLMQMYQLWNDKNAEQLLGILQKYNVQLLHIEHLLDAPSGILNLHKFLNVPLVITLHDYYMICPFIKLTNESDEYCEEMGECECQACLARRNMYSKTMEKYIQNISAWRKTWENYLNEAALVIVPSEDMKKRILRYYPHIRIRVIEDPELIGCQKKERCIGLIGNLSIAKGSKKIKDCVQYCADNNIAIHFILFGTLNDVKLTSEAKKYITILGAYEEKEIYDLIRKHPVDFFWFPGVWPETYSYTLSIPIRLRIPCISTNLGAIASRITMNSWGETYSWKAKANCIIEKLQSFDYKRYYNPDFVIRNNSFGEFENYYSGIVISEDHKVNSLFTVPMIQIPDIYQVLNEQLTAAECNVLWKNANVSQKVKVVKHLDWQWIMDVLKRKGIKHIIKKVIEKIIVSN